MNTQSSSSDISKGLKSKVILMTGMTLAIAVLLAVAGPFGTFERGDFFARFGYWLVVCASGLCVALACKAAVIWKLADMPLLWREAVVILLTTAVFTPILSVLSVLAYPGFGGTLPTIWHLAALVLVVCIAMSVMVNGMPMLFSDEPATLEHAPQTRLARRLPEGFDGQILRLCAEDHLVVVVTTAGIFRVRMRLADAIEEMAGVEGFCTHRSHWVVADSIAGAEQQAGKLVVLTHDGGAVPVSRTYREELENAGYLKILAPLEEA